ncbi:MAG: DNA cytosine methyltransferase [Defluviitaleaceae bacterium]|nr:DNA cytosine methyltransferase [Defluviitaleaceae bacterium]
MPVQMTLLDELIVDNFAGGGGASTGIELATGRPVDIAINHDPDAIAMHKVNHPHTQHFCESVWDVDPRKVTRGRRVGLAWFSPDCKHFSKAKGGKPVNREIRGLAWVAVRWAATVRPRVIILENVEEFKTWGPVVDGKPNKREAGRTFNSFINALRHHGYAVDFRELKACDYGAPTIRKRFFLIARCDGQPIRWPKPTHGDPKSEAVKTGKLRPWRTAAEIIDWTLPCPSIFDTSEEIWKKYGLRAIRPLADTTLRRIARGLQKFVFENPEPFIVDFKFDNAPKRSGEPLGTITSVNGYGVVTPYVMQCHSGFREDIDSTSKPLKTILARPEWAVVAPTLIQYHGEQSGREVRGQNPGNPLLTADAANRYGLVMAFMSKYYSGGHQGCGNTLQQPLNTVTAIDHNALVTSHLTIFRNGYSRGCQGNTEPLNTITATPGHFGEVRAFLVKYYGQGDGQPVTESLHTATSRDTFGLVTIHGEQYAIADIGLRMLTPRELFNAQGFPPDYAIETGPDGKPITKAAQIARCGNAVPPPFAEALVRVNLPELKKIGG